jgi:hypothetical protein
MMPNPMRQRDTMPRNALESDAVRSGRTSRTYSTRHAMHANSPATMSLRGHNQRDRLEADGLRRQVGTEQGRG